MAYLTEHTYSKLCKNLKLKNTHINLNFFLEHIYNDEEIYYMLNKFDISYLYKYKSLLYGNDEYYYFDKVPKREDTKNYVYENRHKLKYHISKDCPFMKKDFRAFNIPKEIKDLGNDEIEFFRNWFKKNWSKEDISSGKIDNSKVVMRYNLIFPKKYGVPHISNNIDSLITQIDNGGYMELESEFNKNEFLVEICNLKELYKKEFNQFNEKKLFKHYYLIRSGEEEKKNKIIDIIFNLNRLERDGVWICETKKEQLIKEYIEMLEKFNICGGWEGIYKKLEIANDINFKLLTLLKQKFKWNYKIDENTFNVIKLENFGLELCSRCSEDKLIK